MAGADRVTQNLQDWEKRLRAAVKALGDGYALKMEAYAKPNAPWRDRTTHARQGLFGEAKEFYGPDCLKVRISHTVDYGVYLELSNQGKYKILRPTVEQFSTQFVQDVERVVRR